ncbi:MAG: response regulator transcription factor [Faecousia sp.]
MSEHILIIEDEAAIQSILSELLTDAGYKVTTASNGLDGITKFREQHYSLVLLDIMIPKIDGYTVCHLIRSESDVPVIMLTALDDEQAQIKAFELKADDYITKPFSLALVLLRIEAVLRRSRKAEVPEESEKLSFQNILLDPVSREVFRGGEPVALTQIEFDLLELFLKNPNRVFTRENLLNQVWGYDFLGDEKAVNIHIMNLRRKLGQNAIETIRGVGYRLGKENKG